MHEKRKIDIFLFFFLELLHNQKEPVHLDRFFYVGNDYTRAAVMMAIL